MSLKPWKPLLLTALSVGAGATAATAQTVAAAQKSIELGRYNEARASLRSNNSPEANYELGRIYQLRGLDDSAAYAFNRAGGATPFGMIAEGRALLAKGRFAEADAKFDAAAKATKMKDAKVLTMIAQAYAESDVKDITKPLTYVDAAQLANKGKDEPALMIARGELYLKRDTGGGEAMTSFQRATTANPNFAEGYYQQGVLYVRSRNGEDAKKALDKAIALDPNYAPAYRELAEMYYSAGQYPKALETFTVFQGKAERSTNTDAEYASFLYLTKKYPEALVEVNKVLAAEPNNLTMNRLKAYTLYETGDFATAATAIDQYMKLAPAEKIIPEDYSYQSKILIKAGRTDEAISVLQKAIPLMNDPAKKNDLLNDLATAQLAKKDYAGALRTYKLNTNPDLADQFRRGSAYSSNKQYVQADSVYKIIIAAKPTYAPAYQAAAQANFNLDPDSKKGLAKPYYEKYLEVTAADPSKYSRGIIEANNYLGYYNLQAGHKAEATPYYQKVLELDPANANATDAMKIIKGVPARPATPAKKAPTTKK